MTLAGRSPARSLHLAQLYGAGLSAAKTDNRIATVDDYGTTQRWAKAFYAHPENIDGIVYMSRYLGDHRSVVLFDRARDAIAFNTPLPLLHHPELAQLMDTYHVGPPPPLSVVHGMVREQQNIVAVTSQIGTRQKSMNSRVSRV